MTALVGGNYVLRLTEASQPGGGRALGDQQLLALARGIELPTDVTDPTSWFDSATALP